MVGVVYALSLIGGNPVDPTEDPGAAGRLQFQATALPQPDVAELDPQAEEIVPTLAPATGSSEAFDRYRVVRLQGRSRQMETMQNILAQPTLAPSERAVVADQLYRLVELSEKERSAEGLLIASGLRDALVFLSEQGAEVILPDAITLEEAQRIGTLMSRIAGVALDRITIIDGAPTPLP